MRLSQTRLRELLLLTGLCGFFFFFRLSAIGFLGPDEPRYAQVAREMLARHDWVTPVLFGHTWLEKPILLYWGEMLAYTVFGVSDWAARIPSAVAATLLVFGTFLTVRRIRYPARLDAAVMIASGVLVLGFARAAATDMLLAAPFCLSLLAWFCWYQTAFEAERRPTHVHQASAKLGSEPTARSTRIWLVLFYALNACAMLAKGPVAPALAALILIAFCAAQRNLRALARTLDPIGLAAFFAIAAPWYILIQLRTPQFFRIFFLEHNLARFGSNLYRHKQPFWYYIPVALIATLPWTIWIVQGLTDAITALTHPPAAGSGKAALPDSSTAPSFTFEIFLLLWSLVPIAFFSISRSKLPGYILPAIPPLLILAAAAVHRRAARNEPPSRATIIAHAILLASLGVAGCIAPRLFFKLPISAAALTFAAVAGTAIFLLVALPLLSAGCRMLHFVTLLPVILAVGFLLRSFAPVFDATQSSRPIAELLQRIEPKIGQPAFLPLTTFALNRNTAFGLAFYLNRLVAPYEGLEISPGVYELPAAIPASAHILITREGSLPAVLPLLSGRSIRFLGSYRPQHVEIFEVSPAL
jgi:4-amino-4-deoxy-L-arabinose transferase-like glycosyltransferase